MFDVGSVVAHIKADLSNFQAGIDKAQSLTKNFKGKLDNLAGSLGSLGKRATAFATIPLVGLATGFVKLASDAEEISSKFDAVFKEGADEARTQLGDMAKTLGRSRTDLMAYAATIQDTFVPLGFARDQAADMSIEIVALAEDLASFNNLRTEDVVRDLQSALVGNTETLRKYGVVAQQTQIEQEALNSGLAASKDEIDAQVKAQSILNLIMKGTTDAQGDAARTADSTANQMRALTSEFKALGEEVGAALIPIVQDLIKFLREGIDWFKGLSDEQKKIIVIVAAVVAAIGPLLVILGVLVSGISAVITIGGALITVFGLFLNPIGLIVLAIGALFLAWKTNFLGIRDLTDKLWAFIKRIFPEGAKFLESIGNTIFEALTFPFRKAWEFISDIVNKIKDKLDFTKRESPSVVDIVNKGVREVNRALGGLDIAGRIGQSGVGAQLAGAATNNSIANVTVNLDGAIIGDLATADAISERIGDQIIKKLQMNVRF